MSDDTKKLFVLKWRYCDGSASGIVPLLFDETEKAKIGTVLDILGECDKDWEFTEVRREIVVGDKFVRRIQSE